MLNLLATAPFDFSAIFSNIGKRWYYYVVLAVFLVFIVLFTIFGKQRRNTLTKTQKLVFTAIFSALAFVANYFTIKASDLFQLSFVSVVGLVAGYTLGAGLGFTASFIGDLICGIVAPFGAYNPIIGIGTGLWGFIPGVLFSVGDRLPDFKLKEYVITVVSFVAGFILNSFAINTFGLSMMYSMTFESLLVLLPGKLAVVGVNAVIGCVLVGILPRILPAEKFLFVKKKKTTPEEVVEEVEMDVQTAQQEDIKNQENLEN